MVHMTASVGWLSRSRLQTSIASIVFALLLAFALLRPEMEAGTFVTIQQASQIRLYGYVGIFLAALVGVLMRRDAIRLIAVPWWMVPALAWCWLSLTWSATPSLALKRLGLTTVVIWLAFYCVRQMQYRVTIAALRYMFVACLAINFITVLTFPAIGIHSFDAPNALHQWRGLMGHKNVAGFVSSVVVILFLFDAKRINTAVRIGVILSAIIFLLYTQSRTASIILVVSGTLGYLFVIFYKYLRSILISQSKIFERSGLILCGVFCFMLLWFTANIETVLKIAEDPRAFSGRNEIWQPMLQFYAEHPIAGAGFGSFWSSVRQTSSDFHGSWLQDVAQGHNGYLDILVQVGFVGFFLILFSCVAMPVAFIYRIIRSQHVSRGTTALLFALLIMVLGQNLSESSLFDRDTLGEVILATTIAMLANLSRGTGRVVRTRRSSTRLGTKSNVVRRPKYLSATSTD